MIQVQIPEISVEKVSRIRHFINRVEQNLEVKKILDAKDKTLATYSELFKIHTISQLSDDTIKEKYAEFLKFSHNNHWTCLSRNLGKVFENFKLFKFYLLDLLNEDLDITSRFHKMSLIHGMGHATISAILLTAFPTKYGVWNGTSERAMKLLELFPEIEFHKENKNIGDEYYFINYQLNKLSQILDIDLWTLDAIWWMIDDRSNNKLSICA